MPWPPARSNSLRSAIRGLYFAFIATAALIVDAADLKAGKALAKSKGCFQCHGASGNTGSETDPPVPKLAGQPKAYLVKAMKDYRSGARQSDEMNILMTPRTDAEIDLLADYFSAQKRY